VAGKGRFAPHRSPDVDARLRHIETYLTSLNAVISPAAAAAGAAKNTGSAGAAQVAGGGGSGGGGSVLAGDVTGPAAGNTVTLLQGVTLTLTSPATGEVLTYDGTAVVNSDTVTGNLTITGTLTVSTNGSSLGATTLTGDLTLSTHNLVTDTTTGTQIGTAATQKLGLWGAPPVVQPGPYTVTNPTPNRSLDEATGSLAAVAQCLGTLIQDLQGAGALG
jgi:hypothetical protein